MLLNVNAKSYEFDIEPETPLLWVLREVIELTGTKYGCGIAQCGACTVHLDGEPVRSCQTLVGDLAGRDITTIEGVTGQVAEAVQNAWIKLEVAQCGYCQSGQVMSAIGLLSQIAKPTDEDIDRAMDGIVCRCATYHRIRLAVHEASKALG